MAQARLVARQSLQDAQAQSQGHLARLPVLTARVESIRFTRDLYRQQYLQLGTRSLLDLLNAEQEYHSSRFEQAESGLEIFRLGVECLYQTDRLRATFALDDLRAGPTAPPMNVSVPSGREPAPAEGAHSTAVSMTSPLAPRLLGLLASAGAPAAADAGTPNTEPAPHASHASKPLVLRVAARLARPAAEAVPGPAATEGLSFAPPAGRQP